jgi:hypothetical protein
MIYDFANAVLLAIGDRLEGNKSNYIMQAWAMLLAYVLHHMTCEKVSFITDTSRQDYSSSRRRHSEVDSEGRVAELLSSESIGDVDDMYAFLPSEVEASEE